MKGTHTWTKRLKIGHKGYKKASNSPNANFFKTVNNAPGTKGVVKVIRGK